MCISSRTSNQTAKLRTNRQQKPLQYIIVRVQLLESCMHNAHHLITIYSPTSQNYELFDEFLFFFSVAVSGPPPPPLPPPLKASSSHGRGMNQQFYTTTNSNNGSGSNLESMHINLHEGIDFEQHHHHHQQGGSNSNTNSTDTFDSDSGLEVIEEPTLRPSDLVRGNHNRSMSIISGMFKNHQVLVKVFKWKLNYRIN